MPSFATSKIPNVKSLEQIKISVFEDNENLRLNAVKTVKDFAGNELCVAEYSPSGYFIYCPDTDTVLESSEMGISPYLGLNDNLFYGGPTYYYIFKNETYRHTISNLETLSPTQITQLKNNCQTGHNTIKTRNLSHSPSTMSVASNDKTVKHPEFYQNLKHCGYISGGVCGFIALGMLIAYKDKYEDNNLMNDKYWEDSGKTKLKSQNTTGITVSSDTVISKKLYDLDPKDSTTSMHIHDVSKKYLKEVGKSANHTSRWKPFFTESTVRSLIDADNPVILFGQMPLKPLFLNIKKDINVFSDGETAGHAVIAYGYSQDKTKFIVHYGWETSYYPDVKVDLSYIALESIYTFDLP